VSLEAKFKRDDHKLVKFIAMAATISCRHCGQTDCICSH